MDFAKLMNTEKPVVVSLAEQVKLLKQEKVQLQEQLADQNITIEHLSYKVMTLTKNNDSYLRQLEYYEMLVDSLSCSLDEAKIQLAEEKELRNDAKALVQVQLDTLDTLQEITSMLQEDLSYTEY